MISSAQAANASRSNVRTGSATTGSQAAVAASRGISMYTGWECVTQLLSTRAMSAGARSGSSSLAWSQVISA